MPEDTSSKNGLGYWGKILHVNLTDETYEFETLSDAVYQKYLSGLGLGAKILWDRMKPGVDPLGPNNILGFTTGLLTDTGTLFTGRFMVGRVGEGDCSPPPPTDPDVRD